jgi:hypothetical protein
MIDAALCLSCSKEPRNVEAAVQVVHDAKAAEVAAGAQEESAADALVDFMLLHVDADEACSSSVLVLPSQHLGRT